jgi:hypothetical protein
MGSHDMWEVLMGRVSRAYPHVSEEELRARLRKAKDRREAQKLLVVLNAMMDPRPAEEIALHTGCRFTACTIGSRPTIASGLKGYSGLKPVDDGTST